jgi:hypothetical protein
LPRCLKGQKARGIEQIAETKIAEHILPEDVVGSALKEDLGVGGVVRGARAIRIGRYHRSPTCRNGSRQE